MMLVTAYLVGASAHQHINNIFGAETLSGGYHSLDGALQFLPEFHLFARMQTVVAVAAVLNLIFLAEIVQQNLAAAHTRLGIILSLRQQLTANLLFRHRFALNQLL